MSILPPLNPSRRSVGEMVFTNIQEIGSDNKSPELNNIEKKVLEIADKVFTKKQDGYLEIVSGIIDEILIGKITVDFSKSEDVIKLENEMRIRRGAKITAGEIINETFPPLA